MNEVQEAESRDEIQYTRQRDWFDPRQNDHAQVTLVGVGGIGSPLALALAKLGIPKLTLIDPDRIENHNLPNQVFPLDDVGMLKVEAAEQLIDSYSPTDVVALPYELTKDGWHAGDEVELYQLRLAGVVCSGLDSMEARINLWDQNIRRKRHVERYIDGRLAGEHIIVLSVNPFDEQHVKWYENNWLYADDEAVEATCTRQSIIDVGFDVAGLMTRQVRRHYAGESVERMIWMDVENLRIDKED